MTSSEQSTSNRPPTTTGRRLGFTFATQNLIRLAIKSYITNIGLSLSFYLLNVDLYVLLQIIAVQVEDQVMDKVESVTDNDQWQLVGQFSFLGFTQYKRPC